MKGKREYNRIPTALSEKEFNEFVLPHLKKGKRGPQKKLSFFKLFNYILYLMHTGCQWENIPIDKDTEGKREIHYTNIYNAFKFWVKQNALIRFLRLRLQDYFRLKRLISQYYTETVHVPSLKKGR